MKRSMLLALSWATFSITPLRATDLPPQLGPINGGSTGTAFSRSCASGQVLTGFRYRTAMWVDAIGLLCRPVNADGTLGSETSSGAMAGGGGGTSGNGSCPSGSVVAGLHINYGSFVNGVMLHCRSWDAATRTFFGAQRGIIGFGLTNGQAFLDTDCENTKQPLHGIRGRFGWYVDALGIVCDEP